MSRRILHVVGRMERGGIQSWLMHLLRRIDRQRYRMDFLIHYDDRPGHYDNEIRELGGRIIPCPDDVRPWYYARNFARIMRDCGPFDVVHSHIYAFSGFVMRLAARHGVPMPITHCHSNKSVQAATFVPARRLYIALMKRWIRQYAVIKVAASANAAENLFGAGWRQDQTVRLVYCGIDLAPFAAAPDRTAVRMRLGLPADALVIGHVGRFVEAKNHGFLVDVAAEAMQAGGNVYLLLVGDGPQRPGIERRVRAKGIAERVIFAGERDDVPSVLGGAMDVFVFPSLHEGLGLAIIEAQAAGLPCLVADHIPQEADIVPALVSRLPIGEPPSIWAKRLMEISAARGAGRSEALAEVEDSPFNIARCVQHMTRIYDGDL